MNIASMNNLWDYLQGLSLTENNRKWLAKKLISPNNVSSVKEIDKNDYKISQRRKQLLGMVSLDKSTIEDDDRLKYILSK